MTVVLAGQRVFRARALSTGKEAARFQVFEKALDFGVAIEAG
jgi:hypothetical protein